MAEKVDTQVKEKMVTLTIDGIEVTVPEGLTVVDAAKLAGIDIPVFCYHPKMEPVGMCRVCLVDIGLPVRSRETGEIELEADGSPKIQFGRALQTGCTTRVSEGMVAIGYSDKVQKARQDVIEFLLTSHPLDCPVCDKGGECPLQNLTMGFGASESRFLFEEKQHNKKHVPLGDLIFLDRERCIQCARCTRFQSEIAEDPVIGFYNRGRSLEIATYSEPGFDSYWSGNTTDICPVGALTTADFRFGARPWEMLASASICSQCSVGCNLTLNTRREAKSGGKLVVKRVMPRQNEQVNETWICDKGRFGYHFSGSYDRLSVPLVRKNGELEPASWDEAISLVAEKARAAGKDTFTLAGGRLSNEDYFNLGQLSDHLGGTAHLYSDMAGGDLVAQLGLSSTANIGEMGAGTAILVIASDLEEEAPLYWLRVKQAAERGATLIVANPRDTKLDSRADFSPRYKYGQEAAMALALLKQLSGRAPSLPDQVKKLASAAGVTEAAQAFENAGEAVILFGSEGIGLEGSEALALACANLLTAAGKAGRAGSGLMAVWDKGNAQGAWDMGLRPGKDLAAELKKAKLAYIAGADPAGDDPALAKALEKAEFVVVQELLLTDTARMADVVLPAQSFIERDGSYTNAERRVQRFYPAVPPVEGPKADFAITAEIAAEVGLKLEDEAAALVFVGIVGKFADYAELDYKALAEVADQWPLVGREDVYYGGASYQNSQGLGVKLHTDAQRGGSVELGLPELPKPPKNDSLLAVPVTCLYDLGGTLHYSDVLQPRLPEPYVVLSAADAETLGAEPGGKLSIKAGGVKLDVAAKVDQSLPQGVVLAPRSLGLPVTAPTPITVKAK
jgi:NADH-quinone oxidoreductase subunit G